MALEEVLGLLRLSDDYVVRKDGTVAYVHAESFARVAGDVKLATVIRAVML